MFTKLNLDLIPCIDNRTSGSLFAPAPNFVAEMEKTKKG